MIARRLSDEDVAQGQNLAVAFHDWLDGIVRDSELSLRGRDRVLTAWAAALGAGFCQPRDEHLPPLHVCIAAV